MNKSDEKGLESLAVWKKALDFAVWVYREIVLPCLPVEEKYRLTSQIKPGCLKAFLQILPKDMVATITRRECVSAYIARGSLGRNA